jgi:hypothetical protein
MLDITSWQGGDDVDPLKESDIELQLLLKKMDNIKKYNYFQQWKTLIICTVMEDNGDWNGESFEQQREVSESV